MKKKIENNNFDEILSKTLEEYVKSAPEEEYPKVEFSQEHKDKMQELFNSVKEKEKKHKRNTILRTAAIIVLAIVLVLGAFTPKIQAWKEKILEFFVKDKEKYSWMSYGDASEVDKLIKGSDEPYLSIFGYLPEGYEYEIKEYTSKVIKIKFDNSIDNFTFKVSHYTNKAMDTEDADYENKEINGFNVIYYSKNGQNSLIWSDVDYVYKLHGTMSYEQLLIVFENINYEKIKEIF